MLSVNLKLFSAAECGTAGPTSEETNGTAGDERTGGNTSSRRGVNNSREACNSSDATSSKTTAETLATSGTPGKLTAEKTAAIEGPAAAQETIRHQ
jgi:hypothetical protein